MTEKPKPKKTKNGKVLNSENLTFDDVVRNILKIKPPKNKDLKIKKEK